MRANLPPPNKRLGQNFLIDPNIVRKIVALAELGPSDHVLEIGPGRGILTEALCTAAGRVTAVEVDPRLHAYLKTRQAELPNADLVCADALAYSRKCSGTARSDRSIPNGIIRDERWIAPANLIERMATTIDIRYGQILTKDNNLVSFTDLPLNAEAPCIFTIPMPTAMEIFNYGNRPDFNYVVGANIRAKVFDCDAYATLYVPDPKLLFNRISISGDEMIVEYAFPNGNVSDSFWSNIHDAPKKFSFEQANLASKLLGVEAVVPDSIIVSEQRYAKIQPIDDHLRKQFLAWLTDQKNVFSLGRFATWRPGLLLDDLVQDVRLIERWINDRYSMKASHR